MTRVKVYNSCECLVFSGTLDELQQCLLDDSDRIVIEEGADHD